MDGLISDLVTLASVIMIDLVLAGDNAIVVGMAACRLAPEDRRRAIAIGIVLALVFRIAFALVAVQLLAIIGLLLAGGLLLLWVAWKLARELPHRAMPVLEAGADPDQTQADVPAPAKTRSAAIVQIAVADISMSLDNVLAVAGAARDNMAMLTFGLVLSVVLMGVAATVVAGVLMRFPWMNYIGLAIITIVAFVMIYDGGHQVMTALAGV